LADAERYFTETSAFRQEPLERIMVQIQRFIDDLSPLSASRRSYSPFPERLSSQSDIMSYVTRRALSTLIPPKVRLFPSGIRNCLRHNANTL
jgi:hypothetical protein